jgi:hypothetical protein
MKFLLTVLLWLVVVRCAENGEESNKSLSSGSYKSLPLVEPAVFSSKRLSLKSASVPQVSSVSGRFSEDLNTLSGDFYDLKLLNECAEFNFAMMNEKGSDKKNRKRMGTLISSFKAALLRSANESSDGAAKVCVKIALEDESLIEDSFSRFEMTLEHSMCISALEGCDDEFIDTEFFAGLVKRFPRVFSSHLQLVGRLSDFSFLTVEVVSFLFEAKNHFMNPFGLAALVQSAPLEVILKCLELWDFELTLPDAQFLFSVWGSDSDFQAAIARDCRSWALLRKLGYQNPFPIDQFVVESETFSVEEHVNLVLAFIYQSERVIGAALRQLDFIHADLHKNDAVETVYMTDSMADALNSHKADLWRANGQPAIDAIAREMELKLRVISALKARYDVECAIVGKKFTRTVELLLGMLRLLKTPLEDLNRRAFVRSCSLEQVLAAFDSFDYPFVYGAFRPHVFLDMLRIEDFWVFLWKQLEIFEVPMAYDVSIAATADSKSILEDLVALSFQIGRSFHKHNFWCAQIGLLVDLSTDLSTTSNSQHHPNLLEILNEGELCEYTPYQIFLIKSVSPADNQVFFWNEADNYPLALFKVAPGAMSRDQISDLLKDSDSRPFILKHKRNIMKLGTIEPFTAQDLLELFPLGGQDDLEEHDAFWTANPEALVGYLRGIGGGVNDPAAFFWKINPNAFFNTELMDLLAEIIPLASLMKYPMEAKKHNLHFIMCDIVGRLERNAQASIDSTINKPNTPQQLILKWILQMEWIFLQFFNIYSINTAKDPTPRAIYDEFLEVESSARKRLVGWLKKQNPQEFENVEELLSLVQDTPLSYSRVSLCYTLAMQEALHRYTTPSTKQQKRKENSFYAQFPMFTGNRLSSLNVSHMTKGVETQISKYNAMLEKHFDQSSIEKQIWSNRARIINIVSINRGPLVQPIPQDLLTGIFSSHSTPICDAIITYEIFARSGFSSHIAQGNFSNMVLDEERKAIVDQIHLKMQEIFKKCRSDLLPHELKLAKETRFLEESKSKK